MSHWESESEPEYPIRGQMRIDSGPSPARSKIDLPLGIFEHENLDSKIHSSFAFHQLVNLFLVGMFQLLDVLDSMPRWNNVCTGNSWDMVYDTVLGWKWFRTSSSLNLTNVLERPLQLTLLLWTQHCLHPQDQVLEVYKWKKSQTRQSSLYKAKS